MFDENLLNCWIRSSVPPGHTPRITGYIFWINAVPTRPVRAVCPCAPSFLYFPRPRCIAAVWWFLLRSRVLRPEDAWQKRFLWFLIGFPGRKSSCGSRQELSNEYLALYFGCKNWRWYSWERTSKRLPTMSQKLEWKLEKHRCKEHCLLLSPWPPGWIQGRLVDDLEV